MNKIIELCEQYKIQLTSHAVKRAIERNIDIEKDIIPAITNGKIIERYPDDYPYESYLILGYTKNNKALHVVCAIGDDILWIITEYHPDLIEWNNDFETRKRD